MGALLASCAVAAALLATRPRSAVSRRLTRLVPGSAGTSRIAAMLVRGELARSGFGWTSEELLRAKVIIGVTFAAAAAVASAFLPIGPAIVALAGYCGFVLPSLRVERAAGRRRIEAERALVTLVEWTEALVASGRPVETAVVSVASRGVGAALVDSALVAASRSYALGAPLFRALAHEASLAGLPSLGALAGELDRARDLGRGALTVLRDERERLRASERARSLDAAGRVEGRLMLVLVLCYLPSLMLLVVVPLFLGLLEGLSV